MTTLDGEFAEHPIRRMSMENAMRDTQVLARCKAWANELFFSRGFGADRGVDRATCHRGHVAGMLYDLGISPPTADLPVFIGQQPAGA